MAWQTPKTNWATGDIPVADDFNRIEGNIQELQNTKETLAGAQAKVDTHAGSKQTHGISSGYYIAKTSRSDQLPAWNDIQGKPSLVTSSDLSNALAAKVDKPSSATSGNIAVFDGGAGKIKDGGIATTNIRTSFYKASGHTQLTFSNISSASASPVREISIPVGSRVGVWLTISAGAIGPYAAYIETTPGVRGFFDSTYFAIMYHDVQIAINQGAEAVGKYTNQDGDFMFDFTSNDYLFFKYLTNNTLMFFVYNNSTATRNYTLDVYWYILD